MTATNDVSSWTTIALVEALIASSEELIARGQPARDIAAELGVDSIEELRGIAAAYDRARMPNGGTDHPVVRITVPPEAAGSGAGESER